MLHFTCSATAAIALCSCTSKLSPISDKDAAEHPFGIDPNQILPG